MVSKNIERMDPQLKCGSGSEEKVRIYADPDKQHTGGNGTLPVGT